MSDTKVFKFCFTWQYKKLERWLEEMESNGKRLAKTDYMGNVFYFEECEPQKVTYCIDYANKVSEKYTQSVYKDGWQLFKLGYGWVVLRKEYTGKKPEFFTEYPFAIRRNKNFISLFVILLYLLAIQLPGDFSYLFETSSTLLAAIRLIMIVITLILVCILGISITQFLGTNIILARKKKI